MKGRQSIVPADHTLVLVAPDERLPVVVQVLVALVEYSQFGVYQLLKRHAACEPILDASLRVLRRLHAQPMVVVGERSVHGVSQEHNQLARGWARAGEQRRMRRDG